MTAVVIQALKTLSKDNVTGDTVSFLSQKLSKDEKDALLKEAAESTDWIYETIKEICGGEQLR